VSAAVWDPAFVGAGPCRLEDARGELLPVPVRRWVAGDASDTRVLRTVVGWCTGPTVDLGCGPGRVVEALLRRGIPALGVDGAASAVALTRARGAAAIRRDVFAPLPGEGRWSHALLLDGNLGIGGDPEHLLRRAAGLIGPRGSLIVELDGDVRGVHRQAMRLHSSGGAVSEWFPWARVGIDAMPLLCEWTGLTVRATATVGRRMCVELAQ
jgi:SAM-dependent methyltransferase